MTQPPDWRASRLKRLETVLIADLGYPLIALLGSTFRWRATGLEHLAAIQAGGRQPIMGFWHGRILPATCYFRRRGIVVITSENFDGEWIARIIEKFGFRTARGSTSRGASKALHQLVRDMAAGRPAGFTLDGPRGVRWYNTQYGTTSTVNMPTARYTLGPPLTRVPAAGQIGTVNPELSQRLGKSTRVQFRSSPEVFVSNGIATLRGTVATDHDRVLAEGLVRLEPGILAVNNQLTLASGTPPSAASPPSVLTPEAGSSRAR